MLIKFNLNDNDFLNKKNIRVIKKICKEIYKHQKIKNKFFFELSIIDDTKMISLCEKYYSNKKTTDVLSFHNRVHESFQTSLLGEIFINNEKVISQSQEYKHSYERELYFLIIHGILHLLNYDHINKKDEEEMFNFQNIILEKIKRNEK